MLSRGDQNALYLLLPGEPGIERLYTPHKRTRMPGWWEAGRQQPRLPD